jgi:hypothetical protein
MIAARTETITGFAGAVRASLSDYSRTEQVQGCRSISRDAGSDEEQVDQSNNGTPWRFRKAVDAVATPNFRT